MKIAILCLTHLRYGGWITYTAHLAHSFLQQGHQMDLIKTTKRTESFTRDFGYGLEYRNVAGNELRRLAYDYDRVIISVLGRKYQDLAPQLPAGAAFVVHDPTELNDTTRELLDTTKPVVIRQAVAERVPGSTFIAHPFALQDDSLAALVQRRGAASISRVDHDKRTALICEANRTLAVPVHIYGALGDRYKWILDTKFPDWREHYCGTFERTMGAAVGLLYGYGYCVDLSVIKGDGGGSQYTFMEAWAAGAQLITHSAWHLPASELIPGENCVAVGSADELVQCLQDPPSSRIVKQAHALLREHHDPKPIVEAFLQL